jgi:phage terminase large subunit-like protein
MSDWTPPESSGCGTSCLLDWLSGQPAEALKQRLDTLSQSQLSLIDRDWPGWAHAGQVPPQGEWATWLFLGGRGAGKTRAGAEWLTMQALKGRRVALVGPTLHDVREVMIEGRSGLRAIAPEDRRPVYEVSRRRLVWPNGAVGQAFSAEDPDSLRGPQFHAAWADEFCAWRKPAETLAMLRLGLRLGDDPRLAVTTTPQPTRALRDLMAEAGTVLTRAGTQANARNLSRGFVAGLRSLYGGTRLEAQEIDGEVLGAEDGLWTRAMIDGCRGEAPERFDRVVVGLDPPATSNGDACGIVVVGRLDAMAYVLADRSVRRPKPREWAEATARAVAEHAADWVIAEVNQGGEMVEAMLKLADCQARVKPVRASLSKWGRAQPVAALYEQGRVIHCGVFPALEDELLSLGGDQSASPDRADALVWAVGHLLLGGREGPRLRML